MKKSDFPEYLTDYFSKYLPGHLGASPNTIMSYRDTFSLLLRYCRDELKQKPEKLTFKILQKKLVEDFLKWLEESRTCSISTRNQRLAAIHAFSRYVIVEAPEYIGICKDILSIPIKKSHSKSLNYLTVEEISSILAQPDLKTKHGRRDLALLSLLYDSGARVQEIVDLIVADIRLDPPWTLKLTGKGNKSRIIPIMPEAIQIMLVYLKNYKYSDNKASLFCNKEGNKLTRSGVEYVLEKYVEKAKEIQKSLMGKKVTPHVLRHSKAMHLLQAGVNIIYIRDLLGHVSVQTTEIYAKIDSDAKRKALEKASQKVLPENTYSKEKEDELLDWLKNLV